ncbi:catalase family peroxidase [Paenisporosarcina sp. TG20]|uniref:catalase family peroxidase n=1 Tax=Paenisporosarcina sp. TG20 TaxID=1211706 RepID=UPI00031B1D8A|nr:catalase family peroxidase [Paenisporosarcina sp. TG20]
MTENTPDKLLAKMTVNRIEEIGGRFPGHRRAHAKGQFYEAIFTPSGEAMEYTIAEHLGNKEVEAIVRFSNFLPNPISADILAIVKGMSVQFQLSNGGIANLVGVTLPVFVTKSPQVFMEILNTIKSFKEGKPNLKNIIKIFVKYPESRAAIQMIRKLKHTKSYATARYYAMHAFYLVNENGLRTPIKFEWEPEAGVETWSAKELATLPHDYLKKEMSERLKSKEVRFQLHIVIGEQGDPTDDPTKEWSKERRRIRAGVLRVKSIASANLNYIVYDPMILPTGIECSDDKILSFRKNAYSISSEKRLKGE